MFGKKPGPGKGAATPVMSHANPRAHERPDMLKREQVPPSSIGQRLIPTELFDPNTREGQLLATLGLGADDESNVIKSDSALKARFDSELQAMLGFIDRINIDLPDGVNVAPYFMIPKACWNGAYGSFLSRYLEVLPYTPWNMLPLPRDAASARALGIRVHPGDPTKAFISSVEGVIAGLSAEVDAAGAAFRQSVQARGKPDWAGMADIVDLTRRKLRGSAWAITSQVYGSDTLRRPRELFYNEDFSNAPG